MGAGDSVRGSLPVLSVFVVPAAGGRGASAGQKIVWLTPKWLTATLSRIPTR